jgi:2-polyprenyl-3-methyl-5-hydroxy-6-metoxy-1,4-benzoquinol methylase
MDTTDFWEARAQAFANAGDGLKAVCSYAMPEFYNRAIDMTQRAAMKDLIRSIRPGSRVLDYGCGVGRWTREIARRGADVTAVDFSATMLAEARTRTAAAGLADRCRFIQSDVTRIELGQRFDVILGVTVLQHVLDDTRLAETIKKLAGHLNPGGRLVLVEAAPSAQLSRCDTATFRARTLESYVQKLDAAGLKVVLVRGVDPSPLKLWVVPRFKSWPRPLAVAALWFATGVSLPIDMLFARLLTRHSWHKIVIATTAGAPP